MGNRMKKLFIVANWKMNGNKRSNEKLINCVNENVHRNKYIEVVICPPFTYLAQLLKIKSPNIMIGAQNISEKENGAFTGEISGYMIKDLNVNYVIIGHSERRQHYAETDDLINKKIGIACDHELNVIFCIGETSEEKEAGKTSKVIKQQLEIIYQLKPNNLLIAYEPVWAIGSGQTASSTAIQEIHQLINKELRSLNINNFSGVVYGGSVNSSSAQEIFSLNAVDGLLIGGASLEGKEFSSIARSSCENFIE